MAADDKVEGVIIEKRILMTRPSDLNLHDTIHAWVVFIGGDKLDCTISIKISYACIEIEWLMQGTDF